MARKGTRNLSSLEDGVNEIRRKRPRTGSPERDVQDGVSGRRTTWFQQLTAAANNGNLAQHSDAGTRDIKDNREAKAGISDLQSESTIGNLVRSTGHCSPRRHSVDTSIQVVMPAPRPSIKMSKSATSPRKLPSTQAKSPTKPVQSRLDEQKHHPEMSSRDTTIKQAELSPHPEKMLKLRSDGKLLSPKSPKKTTGSRAGRKGKSAESGGSVESKIVIIKYGVHDGSRLATARKIQAIIEGPQTMLQLKETLRAVPEKPVQPPKPTHPFFLGKPRLNPETDCSRSHDTMGNKAVPEKRKTNIVSISSPSKASLPNRSNGKTWADVAGSFQKAPRLPGALEAIWPPQGLVHVRPSTDHTSPTDERYHESDLPVRSRKLKDALIRISQSEGVLRPHQILIQHLLDTDTIDSVAIRRPTRKIMTGLELQQRILENIKCRPSSSEEGNDPFQDDSCSSELQIDPRHPTHSGMLQLYQNISGSTTAFDRFECENIAWAYKYAPKRAEEVLQRGPEVFILRDWLTSLTISAVESLNGKRLRESSVASKSSGVKKRRKKRAEALDGFVISSDEEGDQMNEIPNCEHTVVAACGDSSLKRSVVRMGDLSGAHDRSNNAVVISGPHGCGKTAAIYAVAQDLGFEIFEINAGSRRSGKDLLDKVGDMTRNHLVNRSAEADTKESVDDAEDLVRLTELLKEDIASGRQGTMGSFFEPKADSKTKPRGRPRKPEDALKTKLSPKKTNPQKASPKKANLKKVKDQKQSVILLEEVDVLFEDDKQFWATTLEMITRSKRPVIMTCTDESLLPVEDLPLFAILRLTPPPESLAVDYLLLLACNEGHLLSREAVSSLYAVKRGDLRACIAELDFYCQMAIGDTQGGLGWFLIGTSSEPSTNQSGKALRVVSEDSYPNNIGLLPQGGFHPSEHILEHEIQLLTELWRTWDVDAAASNYFIDLDLFQHFPNPSQDRILADLQAMDNAYEALSAADICSPLGLRRGNSILLDTTQPDLSEEARVNYTEGTTLVQADPLVEFTGLSTNIALTIRLLARRQLPIQQHLSSTAMAEELSRSLQALREPPPVSAETLQEAFASLNTPAISAFTSPMSTIITDVAPFVRSITAFDLRLEEQRRQLQAAGSDPRDGATGKRTRTTRASRAALEGGAKATTRRERWFPNTLDFGLVGRTGGKYWMEAALRGAYMETEDKPGAEELKDEERTSSRGGH